MKDNLKLKCQECGKKLTGNQTKFCSKACNCKSTNAKHQNYQSQQKRGWDRKKGLVEMKGGCCSECGYNKNISVLCFHHTDPKQKSFPITIRECSNGTWEKLLSEAAKCILLCHNCHGELHNPQGFINS